MIPYSYDYGYMGATCSSGTARAVGLVVPEQLHVELDQLKVDDKVAECIPAGLPRKQKAGRE